MWTVQDAKAKFSAVVEAAMAGEPQHVTRRGKPAVVVVSEAEWRAVEDRRGAEAFKRHLLNGPRGGPDDLFERDRPDLPMRDIEL